MSILTSDSVNGIFSEAVGSALTVHQVKTSLGTREYLVGVLVDFARRTSPNPSFERPLAFLLQDALQAPPAERLEKLKDVGDGTLYVSGFFRSYLDAKGMDVSYVSKMGVTAYNAAANMLGPCDGAGPNPFGELASNFDRFVHVLQEVADIFFAGSAQGPAALVKLYERWQKTGSACLAQELAARGLVPVRPIGGLQ